MDGEQPEQPPSLMGKPEKRNETWRIGPYEIEINQKKEVNIIKWGEGQYGARPVVFSEGSVERAIKEFIELSEFLEDLKDKTK